MKKRILIAILIVVLASQIPFAYRRYRLTRLREAIQRLQQQRTPGNAADYVDYRGVMHVHTFLGGHSSGTFSELITAANTNHLDFVIMTEHPQADFDTAAMTLNGTFGNVLFINGNEVVTADGDRLLLVPGAASANQTTSKSTKNVISEEKRSGGLSIVAYPDESHSWEKSAPDGIETYNLFVNARAANKLVMFFDGLWSYRSYPDLMFANFFERPDKVIHQWDETISITGRKLVATAGNDAHSNIGVSLNDASGKQWFGMKLDPYDRSFRTVRMHLFIPKSQPLTRDAVLKAIGQGHCYISFDLFADPSGFNFSVANSTNILGDEISFQPGIQLSVTTPLPARIVLFRNGQPSEEKIGSEAQFSVPEGKAAYRVECYLDSLPVPARGKPWIISNPIYVR